MKHPQENGVARIATDPDALEAFYVEHAPDVRAFLVRRVADPHLVADLTADIFLAAIDHADRYRAEHGTPVAWLMGIARNKVADSRRRTSRRLRAESRVIGRRFLDDDAINRIEERIEVERYSRILYAALDSLPKRDRRLVEMVGVDGLSVVEAAGELGVKPGTARVRLHRIRALLRTALGEPSLLASIDEETRSPVELEVRP